MKKRLQLAGQPNQRNLDSLQALIEGKDQRFVNGLFIPIHNPLTGKTTVYFEKRPGFEIANVGDCEGLIAPGCPATAIHFSRAINKYIIAMCDDIFVDCLNIGDTNPDAEPVIDSTFWNPLDVYGATLSNDNYTVTINDHGNDQILPCGGLENTALFFGSTKYYWEIHIDSLTAAGDYPALSFGFLDRLDGYSHHGTTASQLYTPRNIRFSDEAPELTDLYPDGVVWHSNAGALYAGDLLEAQGGKPSPPTISVTLTGVSGFQTGDVLMFALDREAGKLWLGKNGTWFNSGDPAAGTNPQVSGLVEPSYSGGNDPHWRLFFATGAQDYSANQVVFNLAAGNSTFPQEYSAPTGFSSNLPRSSVAFYSHWSARLGSTDWACGGATLNAWEYYGTLDIGASVTCGYSTARMHPDGRYYYELIPFGGASANNMSIGIRPIEESITINNGNGTCAMWNGGGSLANGGASSPVTTNSTGVTTYALHATNPNLSDKLMFAVNRATGKMWIGKNGTWTNSGNPAAGTNPQFENIPNTGQWVVAILNGSGSQGTLFHHPDDFVYSAPSGFNNGIPLTVASA